MRRRDLLGLLAASTLGPQAVLKGKQGPSPRFSAGRLKQSACRWPYRAIPLPDFCRAAAKMGLAGIDLLGADEWQQVRDCGLVCSMGYPGSRRDFIGTGFNDRANHAMLLREREATIREAVRPGVPRGLRWLGQRGGRGPAGGTANGA